MKSIIGILIGLVLVLGAIMLWFGSRNMSANTKPSNEIAVQQGNDSSAEAVGGRDSLEGVMRGAADGDQPGIYTDEQYDQFKEDYNCDLAATAKARCESVDRGPDGLEKCLQMSQYYSYSRHCGEQPE